MIVAQIREGVHIVESCRVECGVEHEAHVGIPVAVNILRTGDGSTSRFHVCSLVRHGIAGRREVHERHDGALVIRKVVIIEEVQVLRERRLQSGVTTSDAQGVAVVDDVEQVAHRRLGGIAAIGQAQLSRLRLLPTEVKSRREVGHRTCRVGMHTLEVLREVRLLRNNLETDIQVIRRTHHAQHNLGRVGVVPIFRHTAQVSIDVLVDGISELGQIPVEIAVGRLYAHVIDIRQAERLTVAMRIAVPVTVAELQIDAVGNGLAVVCAQRIAPVVLRSQVIAVLDGRVVHGVQIDVVVRHRLAGALTPVGIHLQGDVTASVVQTAVVLQHTAQRLRVAVVDGILDAIVLDDTILLGNLLDLSQRVAGNFVRVLVKSGIIAHGRTIVRAVREVWTEHDIGHRVRLPLQSHLAVPLVGTREITVAAVTERRRRATEERFA